MRFQFRVRRWRKRQDVSTVAEKCHGFRRLREKFRGRRQGIRRLRIPILFTAELCFIVFRPVLERRSTYKDFEREKRAHVYIGV